ncbi:MAG TPA: type II toxin-antitoxin system HicA family toxin [Alphaproteobacteria bacterium]
MPVSVRQRRGKGSHLLLDFGDRWTTIPNHPGDLPPGTLRAIRRQLGIDPDEL